MKKQAILLVEDDDAVRRLLTLLLEEAGYTVLPATDGFEALTFLDQNIGLLLTDIVVMPRVDGVALANEASRTQIPIVVMSGWNHAQQWAQGAAWRILSKPFSMRDLLEAVAAALASSRPCELRAGEVGRLPARCIEDVLPESFGTCSSGSSQSA